MFGRKTQDIEYLKDEIKELRIDADFHCRRLQSIVDGSERQKHVIGELRSLNEKLYNAIDKKNEKIRALYYKLENAHANLVIPVPGEFKESK